MSGADLLLPLLIAASAVLYGLHAGRAQASRLRSLHREVSNGKLRGFLTIGVVIAMILATLVF